jgi:hypothetical protein
MSNNAILASLPRHLEERKKMMQQWGDYLDQLKSGAKILPFAKMAG